MNRIKELRKTREMKQAELAKALNCAATAISNYETGYRDIDSETIRKLCKIFGCTSDYLLGLSDNPEPAISEDDARLLKAYHSASIKERGIVNMALGLPQPEPETDEEKEAM